MRPLGCPHCGRGFWPHPRVLGRGIRCRGCRGLFRVPLDPESAQPPAEPTPVPMPPPEPAILPEPLDEPDPLPWPDADLAAHMPWAVSRRS